MTEAVRRDGAKTHILVATTLPSLASKMMLAGWPPQILTGQAPALSDEDSKRRVFWCARDVA
jgi:hypothetical protein